ncbi:hypothetical protein [Vulcanisaeta thermophila]|uniref:hypothetical protein n=1 Tax=Vulcanisaeta thermophila TaxID=867917 RepID=UPI000852F3EE|nr:hypothetical protein [Vulcanisaeta thermophila]
MESLTLNLRRKAEVKGKYVDLTIYLDFNGREFISGVIKCPFTGREFKVSVVPHTDQVRPGFVQLLNGFNDHVFKVKDYSKWIRASVIPVSGGSFHRRKYFVCAQCGFKTTRFVDAFLHLMRAHGFLVTKP